MEDKEIKILKTAILNEIEGEKFYQRAALDTRDPDARRAFLHLAEDERRHQEMLREMMTRLSAGQVGVEKMNLKGTPSPKIFTAARLMGTDDAMEISAFHIAIMMEKASIDYYRQAAAQTGIPTARELYTSLADWEVTHLESMEEIYDFLTEAWWDHQSYSPS